MGDFRKAMLYTTGFRTRNPQPGAFPDLPRRRVDVARVAAGLPSRRKAAPLCMARCGVLSLLIRYCGASGEARTV